MGECIMRIMQSGQMLTCSKRWIFIIEGLLTVIIGIAAYWFTADWPQKAEFVNKKERTFVNARLAADSDATNDEQFSWANVAVALKDPKVWLYCGVFHTLSLPLYTLSLFLVSTFDGHYLHRPADTDI